jgi:ubiquinone/menaquinone biosynthesis C-methylase UbiE
VNDDSQVVSIEHTVDGALDSYAEVIPFQAPPQIPAYLEETYWWAYLHPNSIRIFEREWLVNLILWGNMRRLTQAVLDEIDTSQTRSILQTACVYGDFSNLLAKHIEAPRTELHIVDIADIQLENARNKLRPHRGVRYHHQDSSDLDFPDQHFSQTVVFFLLHEQPEVVRQQTISEAVRVTEPGGKVIFVDYHLPNRSNPFRYLMRPILKWLEPFALDLWNTKLEKYLPSHIKPEQIKSEQYFGGLYQKVVITC